MKNSINTKKCVLFDLYYVKTTRANIHDVAAVSDLMHGNEERLRDDSGYLGAEKHPETIKKNKNGKRIQYIINRLPCSSKKLPKRRQCADKKREHQKSFVRCKVEHVFLIIKNIFRYRKNRYRGLRK